MNSAIETKTLNLNFSVDTSNTKSDERTLKIASSEATKKVFHSESSGKIGNFSNRKNQIKYKTIFIYDLTGYLQYTPLKHCDVEQQTHINNHDSNKNVNNRLSREIIGSPNFKVKYDNAKLNKVDIKHYLALLENKNDILSSPHDHLNNDIANSLLSKQTLRKKESESFKKQKRIVTFEKINAGDVKRKNMPNDTENVASIRNRIKNYDAMENNYNYLQNNKKTSGKNNSKTNQGRVSEKSDKSDAYDNDEALDKVFDNTYVISVHKEQTIQISLYDFITEHFNKISKRQIRNRKTWEDYNPHQKKHVEKNIEKITEKNIVKLPLEYNSNKKCLEKRKNFYKKLITKPKRLLWCVHMYIKCSLSQLELKELQLQLLHFQQNVTKNYAEKIKLFKEKSTKNQKLSNNVFDENNSLQAKLHQLFTHSFFNGTNSGILKKIWTKKYFSHKKLLNFLSRIFGISKSNLSNKNLEIQACNFLEYSSPNDILDVKQYMVSLNNSYKMENEKQNKNCKRIVEIFTSNFILKAIVKQLKQNETEFLKLPFDSQNALISRIEKNSWNKTTKKLALKFYISNMLYQVLSNISRKPISQPLSEKVLTDKTIKSLSKIIQTIAQKIFEVKNNENKNFKRSANELLKNASKKKHKPQGHKTPHYSSPFPTISSSNTTPMALTNGITHRTSHFDTNQYVNTAFHGPKDGLFESFLNKNIENVTFLTDQTSIKTFSIDSLQQDVAACEVYGYIYELSHQKQANKETLVTRICGGRQRYSRVYTSLTNRIVLRLFPGPANHRYIAETHKTRKEKKIKTENYLVEFKGML